MSIKEAWDAVKDVVVPLMAALGTLWGKNWWESRQAKAQAKNTERQTSKLELENRIQEEAYHAERYHKVYERMMAAETERDALMLEVQEARRESREWKSKHQGLAAKVNILTVTQPKE